MSVGQEDIYRAGNDNEEMTEEERKKRILQLEIEKAKQMLQGIDIQIQN